MTGLAELGDGRRARSDTAHSFAVLQQSVEDRVIQFARFRVLQIVLVMPSVPVACASFVVYVGPATTVLVAPSLGIEYVACALLCSDAGMGFFEVPPVLATRHRKKPGAV